MIRLWLSTLVSVALCLESPSPLGAQQRPPAPASIAQARLRAADSTTTFVVGLKDGSSFNGRVRAIQNDSVSFASSVGSLTLALSDVRSATVVRARDIRNGEYWFPNPNRTRLLFAPTGRMLDGGDGYFSNYVLIFPGVAVGLTDKVTIGGGFTIIPGVDLSDQLLYLTPKVGLVATEEINLAIGALITRAGFNDGGNDSFGLLYGVGTFGGENASLTTGVGYGYTGNDLARSPLVMIGGDARLTRRLGLVTENYIFPGELEGVLLSLGMRFFGEMMSFDFGLILPAAPLGGVMFPFVGFVVNF